MNIFSFSEEMFINSEESRWASILVVRTKQTENSVIFIKTHYNEKSIKLNYYTE